jgi:hypothetical protein
LSPAADRLAAAAPRDATRVQHLNPQDLAGTPLGGVGWNVACWMTGENWAPADDRRRERRLHMQVKISRNDNGNPPGKLADAELHFNEGVLDGMKLIGFAIWERRNGSGRNVTFPARQYSVNGERRSFALLRPVLDAHAQDRVRDVILEAYDAHEEQAAMAD